MDDPVGIISQLQSMYGGAGPEGTKGVFNLIDGVNLAFHDKLMEAEATAEKIASAGEGGGAAKADVKAESNPQPQYQETQFPEENKVETIFVSNEEVKKELPPENAVQEADVPKEEEKDPIAKVVEAVVKQDPPADQVDVTQIIVVQPIPKIEKNDEPHLEYSVDDDLSDVIEEASISAPVIQKETDPEVVIVIQKVPEKIDVTLAQIEAVVEKQDDSKVVSIDQPKETIAPPIKLKKVDVSVDEVEDPLIEVSIKGPVEEEGESSQTEEDTGVDERRAAPKVIKSPVQYIPERREEVKTSKQPIEKVAVDIFQRDLKTEKPQTEFQAPPVSVETEESQQLLKDLNTLSQAAQVQVTDVSKLSSKIIDALKESNIRVVQNVQVAKVLPQGIASKMKEASIQAEFKPKEFQSAKATYEDPRMERLKKSIMEQVRFQMHLVLKGKTGLVTLHLRPPMLGSVKVKLSMEANRVDAHFTVENNTVKEVLQKEIAELKSLLTGKGVDINNIEVSVSNDQEGAEGKGRRSMASTEDQTAAREWIRSFISVNTPEAADIPSSAQSDLDPNQIINIVV